MVGIGNRRLKKLSEGLNRIAEWLTIVFFFIFAVLVVLQVFNRYVLKISIPWPEEVTRYAQVWLTFLAASIMIKESGHIEVVFFREMLPRRGQHLLKGIIQLLIIGFLLVLIYNGIQQARISLAQRWASLPHLSMILVYSACPVGGFFMLVQALHVLVQEIASALKEP